MLHCPLRSPRSASSRCDGPLKAIGGRTVGARGRRAILRGVTATEVLRINGDGGSESPLMCTVRRLHAWLDGHGVAYCVVGGLAVVRTGWVRTTHDVDVLVDRDGWAAAPADASIAVEGDSARDRITGIAIDILFPGDDWEMVIPLPEPAQVREYDEDLGAWFIAPAPLVAVKTAVYLSKLAEYGAELAAKDLTDVVELLRADEGRARRSWRTRHPRSRRHCAASGRTCADADGAHPRASHRGATTATCDARSCTSRCEG